MRRDLNELEGLGADVNRMMEYMMGNERENRNRREEVGVHVGDGGRVGRGIRVEPRMEEQEELNWHDDEFEEAFEYGNHHFDGRRFQPPRGEVLEVEKEEDNLDLMTMRVKLDPSKCSNLKASRLTILLKTESETLVLEASIVE
ncbi:hypothetical protein GH714_038014 [Hevea brasiliensis]|uniref:Uncharacterized protein n=1 Tax=Hevea brasiliensis TaxID=3981 RepID=A0A6A6KF66_HEVBR|nr:hypothetical protein GH714_038014 [Hevea brasiliensis]